MTLPSIFSPWYVVQGLTRGEPLKVGIGIASEINGIEYYTSMDEGTVSFQSDPKRAMIFMSLTAASRVAEAEGAQIRVLVTKDDAKEFGR